jgi:MSHA pilin protein MshA
MKRMQAGFTMIELIVVIVILGVLAATALPKFVDVRDEAAEAAINGVIGAMGSAMSINYGGCLVVNHDSNGSLNAANSSKCRKVDNCSDVTTLLQGGAVAGYTVTAAALGTGAAGDNGVSASCTVTSDTDASKSGTFDGISAGNE